ncbi:MAG: ATP-dependent sacrificial sulfur transferase LarE [Phycisphaerae bacterium]|nr:ATP-dependent sacrificial sulfur transferase LarE [Phycisphaerae bacterium]
MNETAQKYDYLKKQLQAYGKVTVAFSGGVDSTFLLKSCVETLGTENVLACIGISPSLAQHQLEQAREAAKLIGVELIELPLGELEDPNYQANKADRCFHCKSCQFRTIQEYAKEREIEHTLCGSNFDDKDDYRPGNMAVKALGIKTPLMDAELTKPDIRELSRQFGLPTAELPASPCLASRVAYGESITEEKLHQVEQAEAVLRSLGFVEFRVRHHGKIARIEVPTVDIQKVVSESVRQQIVERMKELGFQYISLDLQGFRSGSLNETLSEDEKLR